jgi:hypothetical protein
MGTPVSAACSSSNFMRAWCNARTLFSPHTIQGGRTGVSHATFFNPGLDTELFELRSLGCPQITPSSTLQITTKTLSKNSMDHLSGSLWVA